MPPFAAASWIQPRTAYAHVPFCAHHCGYCDFAVTAGHDHLAELYLDAIDAELAALGEPRPVESLFVGGGTPTHLKPAQLARLLASLRRWFVLVPPADGSAPEFSVESTPDSVTPEVVAVLADHGVNRLSIGVQSFRPHLLESLDRQHRVDHVPKAVAAARRRIPALSFDLIFGAPGQTPAEWAADLDEALGHAPEHLSTYGLTYEKGTPLWKARERGRVVAVPEESELAMYEHAMNRLSAAGFEQYEISNFARPGRRSRHNQRYWANDAYFGVGVGAARYVGGVRELNGRDTKVYIRKVLSGEPPTFQSEELNPRERAWETLATQLRRGDGIDHAEFAERTGFALAELAEPRLSALVAGGFLEEAGPAVRLTRRGKCVADGVVAELLKGA